MDADVKAAEDARRAEPRDPNVDWWADVPASEAAA